MKTKPMDEQNLPYCSRRPGGGACVYYVGASVKQSCCSINKSMRENTYYGIKGLCEIGQDMT